MQFPHRPNSPTIFLYADGLETQYSGLRSQSAYTYGKRNWTTLQELRIYYSV